MKIPPSWKEKRRYLIIEYKGKKKLAKKRVINNLIKLIGILGTAKARPLWIEIKTQRNLILSVTPKYLSLARTAIGMGGLRCKWIGGTLKKIKSKLKELEKS